MSSYKNALFDKFEYTAKNFGYYDHWSMTRSSLLFVIHKKHSSLTSLNLKQERIAIFIHCKEIAVPVISVRF